VVSSPSAGSTSLPRQSWRRFSIRELLLLTAAVAAFLAWAGLFYQRSRPYRRTSIPDRVGNLQDIRTICQSLGHRPKSYSAGGGGSSNMHATTRTYDCRIDLPAAQRGAFMLAYRDHIKGLLEKHADRVWGAATTSDAGGLSGFGFEYSKDGAQGTVAVRCASGGDLTLFVFIHEYDARR
jgi:hypothetical protein